jgi:hypothetical protein
MPLNRPTLDYARSEGDDIREARRARIDRVLVRIALAILLGIAVLTVVLLAR